MMSSVSEVPLMKEKLRRERRKQRQKQVAAWQSRVIGSSTAGSAGNSTLVERGSVLSGGSLGSSPSVVVKKEEESKPSKADFNAVLMALRRKSALAQENASSGKVEGVAASSSSRVVEVAEGVVVPLPVNNMHETYQLEPLAPEAVERLPLGEDMETGADRRGARRHAAGSTELDLEMKEVLAQSRRFLAVKEKSAEEEVIVLAQQRIGQHRIYRRRAQRVTRKRTKMTWNQLKLVAQAQFGVSGLDAVEEHDGDAADPLFTVAVKATHRGSVPVPRHWDKLRPFLARQADREPAAVVPPSIELLGVRKHRADPSAKIDQRAFIRCFTTGTPLQRKGFGVSQAPFLNAKVGDVFFEGKWLPAQTLGSSTMVQQRHSSGGGGGASFTPAPLSARLLRALGMKPNHPPPWLYAMQELRRAPPAYPHGRVPGFNAPIPRGEQWGRAEGQWGEPPRAADNNFLFPGILEEESQRRPALQRTPTWGVVPAAASVPRAAPHQPAASTTQTPQQPQPHRHVAAGGPSITPMAFVSPSAVRAGAEHPRGLPGVPPPREMIYNKVLPGGAETTTLYGHVMVPAGVHSAGVMPGVPFGAGTVPYASMTPQQMQLYQQQQQQQQQVQMQYSGMMPGYGYTYPPNTPPQHHQESGSPLHNGYRKY